ncbi:MAG: DnaJ domain-containing protein [Deltaproteobacteria bacterium]|nr:DnaJ domain-containing protein [Deltaproteobacteria bacterium]
MAKDYYKTLGVERTVEPAALKKAYRKLAQTYHPDRNPGDKAAEERFKEITEAYAVLSDAEKRKQYDNFGESGFHQRYTQEDIFRNVDLGDLFGGGGAEDIFSQLFGGGRGRGGARGRIHRPPLKGQDYSMEISVPLRTAIQGGERRVDYRSDQRVEQINVRIPAGIEEGAKLRVAGKGGEAPAGGKPGDLFLQVHIDADPVFRREDRDLLVDVPLPFSQICLGTSVEVPTLKGNKRVKIAAGMQPGSKIRLRGFGVPQSSTKPAGDLYAVIQVSVPQTLSARQRELIEGLAEAGL